MSLNRLDEQDYPALTMGQAAELLGVQQAFLRSLDAADVIHPHRSPGGHRLYSRTQLHLAGRIRVLFDQGHNLPAAQRIIELQDQLDTAHQHIAELQHQLADPARNRNPADRR